MAFDIHLDNGLAGLGVTVHGRCSSSKRQQSSDMGIYIKSIVPGGAAAKVRLYSRFTPLSLSFSPSYC